jgi:hypothetical protein
MNKLSCAILIIFILLAGCGGTATSPKKPGKDPYSGFMDWKAGMWTESTVKEGTSTLTIKTELLENSPDEARFQVTTTKSGKETTAQMWYDTEARKVTKYILKDASGARCMDPSDAPKKRIPVTGEDYPEGAAGMTLTEHTTTSGKEIAAVRFPTKDGEVLVSSEVPFGVVSVVSAGKTLVTLDDFGTIGAKDSLNEEERSQCDEKEPVDEEPAQEAADEEVPVQPDEETAAESPAGDEANYKAEAIDTRTGEVQESFECAKCYEMPTMARNTCLAACK